MELTLRQVLAFLKVINKAQAVDFYYNLSSYGLIHGAKLPSLSEFLGASSNKETNFDEDTDKAFEAHALKTLEERRKKLG